MKDTIKEAIKQLDWWDRMSFEENRPGCLDAAILIKKEYESLLAFIQFVHSQHADDLCWMPADVNKIFQAAGMPPQNLQVGDTEAMRENCDRYIACLQNGGEWKSYAELEKERDYYKSLTERTGLDY